MSEAYWQAKIWALLHDPALKALHRDMSREGIWEVLRQGCMQGWKSPKEPSSHPNTDLNSTWLKYVGLCDLIASASDRTTIGRLPPQYSAIHYDNQGLQIRHLLSGKPLTLKLEQWHHRFTESGNNSSELSGWEESVIPETIKNCTDHQKVYWWFWRCYPQALSKALGGQADEPLVHLLPAETRIPDASLWSHVTMTSALAGALAGYYSKPEEYPQKHKTFKRSRPHVATFSFTPVQELIKASRKMRDFWAGSWLLHYLSAKVCWNIAQKYGPDSLLYPCLYAQPLIDHWLLQKYHDFQDWIEPPPEQKLLQKLLTAGFPNVLVMILPDNGQDRQESGNPVCAAMKYAEATLHTEWKNLGEKVLDFLQADTGEGGKQWRNINPQTWDGWLKTQWQTYWVALPIGDRQADLHQSPRKETKYKNWINAQNDFANPKPALFVEPEYNFLEAVFRCTSKDGENTSESETKDNFRAKQPNMNVGSWWASIFDQTRFSLNAVKNARTWQLPTAFGPRSTVSGIGPVVHELQDNQKYDWATEKETADFWSKDMGLFDGIEELNAAEVLKRGLHKVLPQVLKLDRNKINIGYPDLTSGVAGYLKVSNSTHLNHFHKACQAVIRKLREYENKIPDIITESWGIPWIDNHEKSDISRYHPRLLNPGWLIEDLGIPKDRKNEYRSEIQKVLDAYYPGNNPTDWYVLAAGDGDGMGDWLKGVNMKPYSEYIPDALHLKIEKMPAELQQPLQEFLKVNKRMGPSTHSALSRALLDFSNQLVPYLTEERYAGRLIYGGGDDVLAYTNLWEWDSWLWDIRQCFRGDEDPGKEFKHEGDYWQWLGNQPSPAVAKRPLFTMGSTATISFGIVIAHHSVPLAIALENLWASEKEAKDHKYHSGCNIEKDAAQVRILYGNGNILKATSKFDVFNQWQQLLKVPILESAIFEQAAQIWSQHPAPVAEAIAPWTKAFCDRRDLFKGDNTFKDKFQHQLADFLNPLWLTTPENDRDRLIQNWLKLAAFVLRNRDINLGGQL